ncbi:hypothetical protein BXO88_13710 [Oribacterium sp. C9]|uniref:PstS family phosphate ABC transporter substrate-binding protein n=1 Tax=Oribacterium sp. C9 TaxID=1943579 RepID=UPI0009CA6E47|nr:substrate-binding domain-containing protein [Oribacterium sp. C9]OON85208.1 hypothetical protein BXO88_13710 [Oribacterium sp. C9]
MRKRISAAMIAMAALAVSGCSVNKPVTAPETTKESPETTEALKKTETTAPEKTEAETAEETVSSTVPIKLPDYRYTRENFPRMDGSTATVPLGKAIAGAFLNIAPEKAGDLCQFNRTTQSFRNLLSGDADILIVGEPNAKVFKEMDAAGFKYRIENIATDALIFVVNEDNPVDSLTTDQIRDIYSGKITNWKEVGGNDAEIIPFQRNEGAGSQALILKHIMKDTPMVEAPSGLVASEMGELMTAVKSYDNSANAIGYSVYYYANDMKMAKGLKIIAVDGVKPNPETIRNEEYPHRNAYYSVIPEEADLTNEHVKGARVLYDWLVSEDGQRLISSMGYVSVMDVSSFGDVNPKASHDHVDNYTRLDDAPEGSLTELKPRDDYDLILPYEGNALYVSFGNGEEDGYSYLAGYMEGFFDVHGRLITDPVYNSIESMDYYDPVLGNEFSLPYYRAIKYDMPPDPSKFNSEDVDLPESSRHQQLISKDGRFVSPEYGYISGMKDHVMCKLSDETADFEIYDLDSRVVMTLEDLDAANGGTVREKLNIDYLYDVRYSEGYYVFEFSDGYYYIDEKTHKIALGPYGYAEPFENGRAFVRIGDYASIIDTSGKELIGSGYNMAVILSNGSIAANDNIKTDLFDSTGKLIKQLPYGSSVGRYDWGFYIGSYKDGAGWTSIVYDNDGNELVDDTGDFWSFGSKIPVGYAYGNEDGPVSSNSEDRKGIWLRNFITGKELYINGSSYANPFYTIEGTADVPYITVSFYDDATSRSSETVYDAKLKEVHHVNGGINVTSDKLSNKWMFTCSDSDSNHFEIHDKDFKVLLETDGYPSLYDGYALFVCDNASIGLAPDGKEIFCYRMSGSFGNE